MKRIFNLVVSASTLFLRLSTANRMLQAADPLFSKHIIENQLAFIKYRGLHSALADVNGDGKLDFIVSNFLDREGSWPNIESWTLQYDVYQYVTDDRWIQKTFSREKVKNGAGNVVAIQIGPANRFSDLALGGSLLLNRKNDKKDKDKDEGDWTEVASARLPVGAHDILALDVDRDQRMDLVYVNGDISWYRQGASYADAWEQYAIDLNPRVANGGTVHGGIAPSGACDLNGDNYPDLAAPGRWYENPGPNAGTQREWKKHFMTDDGTPWGKPLIGQNDFAWGYMVRSWCADLDGDGDKDIIQSEGDYHPGSGRIGWLENSGDGEFQTVHWIKDDRLPSEPPHDFHSLGVFDYDGDGDLDVFSADGTLLEAFGNRKAVYIFENTTPRRAIKPTQQYWKQHTFLLGYECHDAKVGDVDGDGKIDIVCRGYQYNDQLNPVDPPFLFLKNETP